jgi:hypothetical protein
MKQEVHDRSDIAVDALVEKYLGLPTPLGRSTDSQFGHIVTNIKKLVKGWCLKTMSSAAREVLVKSICQAIPTNPMSCFQLSKNLCKKITSMLTRFWRRGDENKGKIHWKKWKAVAIPNFVWGWVLEIFSYSNQAMLAKQGVEIDSKS